MGRDHDIGKRGGAIEQGLFPFGLMIDTKRGREKGKKEKYHGGFAGGYTGYAVIN